VPREASPSPPTAPRPPWSGRWRLGYSIVIFIVLSTLDNVALGVPVPLYPFIARGLDASEGAVGAVTALMILVTGAGALALGFAGDRVERKPLILFSTLIWVTGMITSASAGGIAQYATGQLTAAVGFGGIISVGFSVIADMIPPERRGLLLSIWGLSQGLGVGTGVLLGGLLGPGDWRLPFWVIAASGLVCTTAYLLAVTPPRGLSERELGDAHRNGARYSYHMRRADIAVLLRRPATMWLVVAVLFSQLTYGSFIWLPRLFAAKAEAAGLGLEAATTMGSIFAVVFQVGGLFSVVGGHLGDRFQRKDPRGRTWVSAFGLAAAVPFLAALFLLPLHGLVLQTGSEGTGSQVWLAIKSMGTNPWVAAAFLLALIGIALSSLDSPNWFALMGDLHLPEHRGTVMGLGHVAIALGRSGGTAAAAAGLGALAGPDGSASYAITLTVMLAFFFPAAAAYLLAGFHVGAQRALVRHTMTERAFVLTSTATVAASQQGFDKKLL
jgi:MFS family permease